MIEGTVGVVAEGAVGIDREQRAGGERDLAADGGRIPVHRGDRQHAVHVDVRAVAVVGKHVAADAAVLEDREGVVLQHGRIVDRRDADLLGRGAGQTRRRR